MTTKNRSLHFERVEGDIGVVTIDVPGRTQNVLTESMADELDQLWTAVQDTTVRALVIRSRKPGSWMAGADIEHLRTLATADAATALSRRAQEAFDRLEQQPLPVVAAIHGPCLGGGLELALACNARVASDAPETRLGLPEVQVGLLPGAGGTQRLPAAVGIEAALDLMLTGKHVRPNRAQDLGLVDTVVPEPILMDVALALAGTLADEAGKTPTTLSDRAEQLSEAIGEIMNARKLRQLALAHNPAGRKLVFDQALKTVRKTAGDHYPAPYRILEAVRIGLEKGRSAGLDAEADRFGELAMTDVAQRLIDTFLASRALSRDDGTRGKGTEPSPVRRVGVLGAGLMGHGIATVTARHAGLTVRVLDRDDEAVARGLASTRQLLDGYVDRKRIDAGARERIMNRITGTTDWSGFGHCDVVIEAVYEDLELKRRMLAEMEARCAPDAVFATNTSSIPVGQIAAEAQHPERVVGMHYFSPVHRMPLLEVVRAEASSDEAIATAVALGRAQGKTVMVVNDGVGFYTTRILAPYLNEAAWLLAEGVPIERIDDAARLWGFSMGPIELLDAVGIDTAARIADILHDAFGDRLRPPTALKAMVEDGRTGRRAGKGFYTKDSGRLGRGAAWRVDPAVYEVLGVTPDPKKSPPLDALAERLGLSMVSEALRCLSDGVLRSSRDGDVGAVFGLGFPAFRGGPFRYADQVGAAALLGHLERLEAAHGPRFAAPGMIADRARTGHPFHD